jgi:membrane-associated phospholipid phosphatase
MSQKKFLKEKPGSNRFFFFLPVIISFCLIFAQPNLNGAEKVHNLSLTAEPQLANSYPDRVSKKYFQKIADDMVSLWASPLHWHGQDWLNLSLSLVAGSSFFPADNSIHLWTKDLQETSPGLIKAGRLFSAAGSPLLLFGFISGGYLAGEITSSAGTRQSFLLAAESLLLAEVYVQVFKTGFGRARPFAGEGAFSFHPLSFKDSWNSLPSGHAAAAWAVASSVSSTTESSLLRTSAFLLASAISLSRIILDKHFASDVVFGSLLGYFIGQKISSLNKTKAPEQEKRFHFYPQLGPGFIALSINFSLN